MSACHPVPGASLQVTRSLSLPALCDSPSWAEPCPLGPAWLGCSEPRGVDKHTERRVAWLGGQVPPVAIFL